MGSFAGVFAKKSTVCKTSAKHRGVLAAAEVPCSRRYLQRRLGVLWLEYVEQCRMSIYIGEVEEMCYILEVGHVGEDFLRLAAEPRYFTAAAISSSMSCNNDMNI